VAGALKLAREHHLTADQIQRIRVRTFEAATRLPNDHPRDTEEAQYNLAFPVAAALLDGEVGPKQVLPPRLHDPELLSLLDRVTTEVAPEFEAEFPAKAPAEVVVETTAGGSFRSGRIEALWEPPDTLPTDEELETKFHGLVSPILGESRCNELERVIWNFDQNHSAHVLIHLCGKSGEPVTSIHIGKTSHVRHRDHFGGAGNNLTRLLTGMSSIIYRAPDSTGIAAFGDDTEPIRLRKAVGSMTQLLERLHQRGIYPCPERHLATFRTDEGEADNTSRQQKQLLLFEGVTLEYVDGIQDGSLTYLNFDDLVNPDPGQQKRLCPGWPGAPLSHPRFVIRSKKDLVTLIQHLITEFDLSPTAIQFIIRHALQRTIDRHAARDSLEILAEDILRTFDEIYEKIITRERISPPRRLNYGFPAKSLYPHRYVWRYLIESPIEIPSDYDRDGVRGVFRPLDAALLSRLPFDSVLIERLQKILDTFWPESQRTVPVEWRSLYAAEKGINVFGWAAATALTYLQREEFLPAFLNSHPDRQLISAEAIVAGQTDPVSLRYFSQPVMAHGRWAIQSAVTEKNAHPFTDEHRQRVIVLNGQFDSQVEEQTRRFLEEVAGVSLRSENSAEYFALLWGYYADLLQREQRHSNAVRSQVETGLENYAIGSQAMDYGVYR